MGSNHKKMKVENLVTHKGPWHGECFVGLCILLVYGIRVFVIRIPTG